jgi:hypothetical protein
MDAEVFYSSAYTRILRFMLILTAGGALFFLMSKQKWLTLAFLGGASIAFINVHWLRSFVNAVAERISETQEKPPASGVVRRFLFRYVLIALVAYVILKSYPEAIASLFAGLLLPVGAILCEAGYELVVALKQGI